MIFIIGIIKGDIRYTYLHSMLDNSILSNKLEDFYNVNILILPLKGIDSDDIIYGTCININNIISNNSIKTIIVGNASNRLKAICKYNCIVLLELMKDEQFTKDNALLTAKGLLYDLHNNMIDISNYKILIIGYGNIAYYLSKLLDAAKADYSIIPMNEYEKKYLLLADINIENDISNKYSLIINTVPNNHNIDYSLLLGSKIVDVASYPYGFDPIMIEEYKIDYKIIPQIPSKFAPLSAAILIKNYISRINCIV